mmetsp:Transcript_20717/g.46358  ORF Transcript_20717/g.46358 Transcript_20717/m.46358 type:complete len:125 (-) Transcript_20717:300-674(-)
MSLMDQINAMTNQAQGLVMESDKAGDEIKKKITRVRRKSRELEEINFGGVTLSERDKLRQVFDSFDVTRDGNISKDEMHEALKKSGKTVTKEALDAIFLKLDTDGNNLISFDEFCQYYGETASS